MIKFYISDKVHKINLFAMHEVMNTTTNHLQNRFTRAKVALGNSQPRYNSKVEGIQRRYYINSTLHFAYSEGTANKLQNG